VTGFAGRLELQNGLLQKNMAVEDRYERLIQYLTDYIYTVTIRDGEAIDTYHGPGCVSVTGYTSEDYKADPDLWYKMVPRGDREHVLEQARLARTGSEVPPLEHRIVHRDGYTRWIRNTIVVTKNDIGIPIAYDGLINDITERKRIENEQAVRTQQLIHADKMASLGILVSGIAHEINNPNNFILLNSRLFSRIWNDVVPILDAHLRENGEFSIAGMPYSSSREKLSQSIQGILSGSERIQNITRNLTDYARNDGSQFNDTVDVNRVTAMAIVITDNLIKHSTDDFQVEYGERLPAIRGNAQQLEQVIINLITNACQSLRARLDEIRVKTYYEQDTNEVRIAVVDRGSGIKRDDMKHIMDPFFTTRRDMGGSGLGLSVSFNIVKAHGGRLVLTSEPGHGTIATIYLPVIS
jgi:PAS domain S-box-containing protein